MRVVGETRCLPVQEPERVGVPLEDPQDPFGEEVEHQDETVAGEPKACGVRRRLSVMKATVAYTSSVSGTRKGRDGFRCSWPKHRSLRRFRLLRAFREVCGGRRSGERLLRSSFCTGSLLRRMRPLPSLRSLQKKSYREKCDPRFGLFRLFGRFRTSGLSNTGVPLQRLRSLHVGWSRAGVAFVARAAGSGGHLWIMAR